MLGTFEKYVDTTSDESDETDESSGEENYTQQTHFMNMTPLSRFEKNRDMLYTKDILKKRIVIDSHNYFQSDSFDTSNYLVQFDFDTDAGSSLVTTNYDIYHNVIGFRLVRTTIRTPPFNVNTTNNVIRYKKSSDPDTALPHTLTIKPGVYTMHELAAVFQKFNGSYYAEVMPFVDGITGKTGNTVNTASFAQHITYSDALTGQGTSGSVLDNPGNDTFSATFHEPDSVTSTSSSHKSMNFEIVYNHSSSSDEITFLWDYDNVTRGAARLFGFIPTQHTSSSKKIHSNRTPDVSTHFVDLVIPQIPSIGCKRNSSGRDIVERIQLSAGHGDYLHYSINVDESPSQQYFAPITLHRLNIQLYAVNNVLYDTNNSDNSFEFEITMVKNKKLLT